MNTSEQATADLLDSLGVRWEYEPWEFVLARNDDGVTLEGFRPDFYICEHDFYIEVTMARQPHTTRKNRKARLTRQLHGVRVEILYRRDFLTPKTLR